MYANLPGLILCMQTYLDFVLHFLYLDLYVWFLQHLFRCNCFVWKCLYKHSCRFLTKLLTEDLPKLFVRPKKIVLNFQKGMAVGPVAKDSKPGETQEGNSNFAGELSVTLLDARKLSYIFYGMNFTHSISKWNISMLLLGCSC